MPTNNAAHLAIPEKNDDVGQPEAEEVKNPENKNVSQSEIFKRSHTNIAPKRGSIMLDASMFRLERKTVLEKDYELLYMLGKGTYGEVRLVKHTATGVKRAMKTISKANAQMSMNFVEEISILKKLDHPNVLRLYEFYQDENNFYLITEYFDIILYKKILRRVRSIELDRQIKNS